MSAEIDKKMKTSKSRRETAVQGTNDSSIVSKCSMAAQGYFDDPYLQNFVTKVTRRAPLIHRGYYVRAKTLDFLVKKFLQSCKGQKQILSLGAGFDSAFFRLSSQQLLGDTVYCEVDFPDVVKRKNALIKMNDVLSQMIPEEAKGKEKSSHIELSSRNYKLVGVDLSQINTMEAALKLCDIDFDVPNLLLSEVVLTYMTRRCSSAVIKWAAETFCDAVFIMYEQVNPNDAFGLFMQNHFRNIGSPLKCINAFPTMESQLDRFRKLGWDHCEAVDINTFYQYITSGEERNRVEKLEPFDEYEEFNLKCSHYMALCAYRGNKLQLLSHIGNHAENVRDDPDIPVHENCIKVSSSRTPSSFCRFGHVTADLGSDWLMSVGGFGEQGGKHMRVTDITLTSTRSLEIINIDPQVNNKDIEVSRMHATASCLQDGTILLIGGRVSPMKVCTQLVALKLNCGLSEIRHGFQCLRTTQGNLEVNRKNNSSVLEKKHKCTTNESKVNFLEKKEFNSRQMENPDSNTEEMNCDSVKEIKCDNLNDAERRRIQNENVNKSHLGIHLKHVENLDCKEIDCSENFVNNTNIGDNPDMVTDVSKHIEDGLNLSVKCCIVKQEGEIPCPRWRHSVVTIKQDDKEKIVLFGGRTQDTLALCDCYCYDTLCATWTKVNASGNFPSPRHSHSASFWDGHMIIAGGLGDDLQPLDSVHILNLETYTWSKLVCKMPPRYSHTSCVIRDLLLLIGGVGFSHRTLGVTVIHLRTGRSMEFSLPEANKDDLMMLHGHTSVAIDNNRILILGGGGNCFSFGTHLNSSPLIMDLTEVFHVINAQLK